MRGAKAQMDAAGTETNERVRAEQIRMVYLYSPTTTAASLLAGAFLVWVLWNAVPHTTLYVWSVVLVIHQAVRMFHYRRYMRAHPGPREAAHWGRLYIAASTVAGCIWGSTGIFFYVPDSLLSQVYLCLVLFGIASLTIPTISIFAPAFYPLPVLVLTPFIVRALGSGQTDEAALAVPLLIVLLAAVTFGRRIHRLVDEAIRRRFENLRLIEVAERARGEAEASSRAKSRFLATMSHELRTPLNAIIGYSELMTEHPARFGTEGAQEPLKRILRAGRLLLNLINELLDLAKIESGKITLAYEDVELRPLLDDVVDTMRSLAEQNRNALTVTCPSDIGLLHVDRKRLTQVLLNLLSNASKFTHEGRVDLSVSVIETGGRRWVDIAVTDTGIGMTPEQLNRIFNDFTQADASTQERFGGTGLGLAISRRLCQMMGGQLIVVSQAGQGSTFTARLPSRSAEAAPSPAPEAVVEPSRESTIAIDFVLLADADPVSQEAITTYLTAAGIRVVATAAGIEALQWARDLRPAAIIVDTVLTDINCWSLLAALKHEPSIAHVPVIIVATEDERDKAIDMGACDCLTKPIDRPSLERALAGCAQQRVSEAT